MSIRDKTHGAIWNLRIRTELLEKGQAVRDSLWFFTSQVGYFVEDVEIASNE